MTSRATPSSTSFALPSTQNTAPIIEFRCLYTHDLRRKQKRWRDGFLRFHTFNKRIMIYDVQWNYIADHHYRDSNVLVEGAVLQVDGGILVDMGEEISRIKQNRDELLKQVRGNRKAGSPGRHAKALDGLVESTPTQQKLDRVETSTADGTAPMFQHPEGHRQLPYLSAQLKSRSLSQVLGISRKRQGRALVPQVSPFEVCQIVSRNANIREGCTSTNKRRKINHEQPKEKAMGEVCATPSAEMHVSSAAPKAASWGTDGQDIENNHPRDIVALETTHQTAKNVIGIDPGVRVASLSVTAVQRFPRTRQRAKASEMSTIAARNQKTIGNNAAPSQRKGQDPPTNPIRLQSRRPRPKLLCQAFPHHLQNTTGNIPAVNTPQRHANQSNPPIERITVTSPKALPPPVAQVLHFSHEAAPPPPQSSPFFILSSPPSVSKSPPWGEPITKATCNSVTNCQAPIAKQHTIQKRSLGKEGPAISHVSASPRGGRESVIQPLVAPLPQYKHRNTSNLPLPPKEGLPLKSLTPKHPLLPKSQILPARQQAQRLRRRYSPKSANPLVPVIPRESTGSLNGVLEEDDNDLGPWSREAGDLFAWRRPEKAAA
ncbi:MAG: hypothetical protein M1824_003060 [Vezdaea acicularis]|nr:MAG: hypothetical protein M1824_003060 [Vezdaea acicularis]